MPGEFNMPPGVSTNDIPGNRPEDFDELWVAFSPPDGYGAGGYPIGVFDSEKKAAKAIEIYGLGAEYESFKLNYLLDGGTEQEVTEDD